MCRSVAGATHPAIAWYLGYVPPFSHIHCLNINDNVFRAWHNALNAIGVRVCVLWRLPAHLPCHVVLFARASMHSRGRTHINNLCLKSNINLLWIFNFWYAALPWTNGTIQFSMEIFDGLSQKIGLGPGEVCAWVYLCVCVCVFCCSKNIGNF